MTSHRVQEGMSLKRSKKRKRKEGLKGKGVLLYLLII